MDINKELLLTDLKLQEFTDTDSIDRLFKFFSSVTKASELENCLKAKNIYKMLGWQQPHYDVINSFWIIFSFSIHSIFPQDYGVSEAGNVKIYKNYNKEWNSPSFPEKYLNEKHKENTKIKTHMKKLCDVYPNIAELAELCHCVANFMPCPQDFNSQKGLLTDVKDFFPLMIDKIQYCVDERKEIGCKKTGKSIPITTINKWHQFFVKNRDIYCLDMYYNIDKIGENEKITGIKFFKGQSLERPCPQDLNEVKECLNNILNCIKIRAERIMSNRKEELR